MKVPSQTQLGATIGIHPPTKRPKREINENNQPQKSAVMRNLADYELQGTRGSGVLGTGWTSN